MSEQHQSSEKEVIEAVKNDGLRLKDFKEFSNHREVVFAAVKENGYALIYAAENLRNDKHIVLEAFKQNGFSLYYAGEKLLRKHQAYFKRLIRKWILNIKRSKNKGDIERIIFLYDKHRNNFFIKEVRANLRTITDLLSKHFIAQIWSKKEIEANDFFTNTMLRSLESIKNLSKNGVNVNVVDKKNRTALMHLASKAMLKNAFPATNVLALKILIRQKADPNIRDKNNKPAWRYALESPWYGGDYLLLASFCYLFSITKDLKKKDKEYILNFSQQSSNYAPALIMGILINDLEIINKSINMIEEKLNKRNKFSEILTAAAMADNLKIVKYLVEHNKVHVNTLIGGNKTALIEAAASDSLKVVKYLVEKGANIHHKHTVNESGPDAISRATDNGCYRVIKYLIKQGVNSGINNIIYGLDTGLRGWVRDNNFQIVKLFIEKGGYLANDLKKALDTAVKYGHLKMVKYLVRHGAKINPELLMTASKNMHWQIVKFLIAHKVEVNCSVLDDDNIAETAISLAIINIDLKSIKYLIQAGATIEISTKKEYEDLVNAIKKNDNNTIERLVLKFREVYLKNQKIKIKLMDYDTQPNELKMIIDKNPDLNIQTELGILLKDLIDYHPNLEIIKYLLSIALDVNKLYDRYGVTPLMQAVEESNYELVRYLLSKGLDINARDQQGYNALCYVKEKKMAEYLLSYNLKDVIQDWNALFLQSYYNAELMEYCLQKGANINYIDEDGETALLKAIWCKSLEDIIFLLKNGADIHIKSNNHVNALHMALFSEMYDIAKTLIEKGADINAETTTGYTPFTILARSDTADNLNEVFDMMNYLLKKGVDINAQNKFGMTVFDFYLTDNMLEWLYDRQRV